MNKRWLMTRLGLVLIITFSLGAVDSGPGCLSLAAPPEAPADRAPNWNLDWARDSVFYEVFVRSFADSNGDGVGDFRGLIAKLDYLDGKDAPDSLGVDAIWLMPIFGSPSYHGYDTTNYRQINPIYGSEADFDQFIREAHRRGLRVILDLVLNHTSDQHPWFRSAAEGPASPYRNWYVWRRDDPGWTPPWGGYNHTWHPLGDWYYYGVFWGGMPDLNWENEKVRKEAAAIARFWLKRGADGFRLDAIRHLVETGPGDKQCDAPDTHRFLKEFAAEVRRVRPDALLVGEIWNTAPVIAKYHGSAAQIPEGDELPMNFDFPLASAAINSLKAGHAQPISDALRQHAELFPKGALRGTFLTNHDMVRVATVLGGDPGKMRLAAALLLTTPGTPFIYYGEELGLVNGPETHDQAKRTPMPWNGTANGGFTTGTPWYPLAPDSAATNIAAERGKPDSLWTRYRELIHLRKQHSALRRGRLEVLGEQPAAILGFLVTSPDEKLLVVHNISGEPQPFSLPPAGSATWVPVWSDRSGLPFPHASGKAVTLPAFGSAVWRWSGSRP